MIASEGLQFPAQQTASESNLRRVHFSKEITSVAMKVYVPLAKNDAVTMIIALYSSMLSPFLDDTCMRTLDGVSYRAIPRERVQGTEKKNIKLK